MNMEINRGMSRRGFLVSSLAVASTAGCLGAGGNSQASGPSQVDGEPTKGDEDAPVTVVEYFDFSCSHCRSFHEETMPALESRYIETGDVKFVHRNFPVPVDDWSQTTAIAGEAVYVLGGDDAYWEYVDRIFARQGNMSMEYIETAADEVGVDGSEVRSAVESEEYLPEVNADRKSGEERGVSGTPAVFVNGEQVKEGLASAIESEM
ncbi:MAG: thioredoxin domain-containing protein [Halobacteria archaeon]|nr:thioredoxin domain-containing protein [Halobacteria archaeon]